MFADHLDELILFDQIGAEKKFDEGVARQRLGLLNADGRPELPLVPMVSADGRRAAYEMDGSDTGPFFDSRLVELKENGGVLTVLTHGNEGVVEIDRELVKGFGTGTGSDEECAEDPVQITTARTNVTVNFAVCFGAAGGGGVTSVATTLTDAITAAGGSVRTMNASGQEVD